MPDMDKIHTPKEYVDAVNKEKDTAQFNRSANKLPPQFGFLAKLGSFLKVMWIRATTWNDEKLKKKAEKLFNESNSMRFNDISWFKTAQIKKFDFLGEVGGETRRQLIDKAIMNCFFQNTKEAFAMHAMYSRLAQDDPEKILEKYENIPEKIVEERVQELQMQNVKKGREVLLSSKEKEEVQQSVLRSPELVTPRQKEFLANVMIANQGETPDQSGCVPKLQRALVLYAKTMDMQVDDPRVVKDILKTVAQFTSENLDTLSKLLEDQINVLNKEKEKLRKMTLEQIEDKLRDIEDSHSFNEQAKVSLEQDDFLVSVLLANQGETGGGAERFLKALSLFKGRDNSIFPDNSHKRDSIMNHASRLATKQECANLKRSINSVFGLRS
jgi:hypothetical protein